MTNVAFLGLGNMGLPMALNLQRKGFHVVGWNRTHARGLPLQEAGGRLAATPAEAVRDAAFIVTMLGGPESLANVAVGASGFLSACAPGTIWLESSTIGPTAVLRLAEPARAAGVVLLDAPVTGTVPQAEDGSLKFLVGGDDPDIERAAPLLRAMGQSIIRMGALGQGAAAKCVNNMLVGALLAAHAEALALAEQLGLDRRSMIDFLAEGVSGAPLLKIKAPLLKAGTYPAAFQIMWLEKDLRVALTEATQLGVPAPMAGVAHSLVAGANAAGYLHEDMAVLAEYVRTVAGQSHR